MLIIFLKGLTAKSGFLLPLYNKKRKNQLKNKISKKFSPAGGRRECLFSSVTIININKLDIFNLYVIMINKGGDIDIQAKINL